MPNDTDFLTTYLVCSTAADSYERFVKFLKYLGIPLRWESPHMKELWPQVGKLSLLDPFRADMLLAQLESALHLEGDIAEFAVYRGGTAVLCGLLLRKLGVKKRIHLFDSFQGLPAPDRRFDHRYAAGEMMSQEGNLRQLIRHFDLEECCVVHSGWFEETTSELAADQRFCFIHLDCDLYESAVTALKAAWPRLTDGALVAVDDYYDGSGGVKQAIDEVLARTHGQLFYGPLPQVYVRKKLSSGQSDALSPFLLLSRHSTYATYLKAFRDILIQSAASLEVVQKQIAPPDTRPSSSDEQVLAALKILLT